MRDEALTLSWGEAIPRSSWDGLFEPIEEVPRRFTTGVVKIFVITFLRLELDA
jgi:hypothetical protein